MITSQRLLSPHQTSAFNPPSQPADMNLYAAAILIPVGVIMYTAHGGLKATFMSTYLVRQEGQLAGAPRPAGARRNASMSACHAPAQRSAFSVTAPQSS